MNSNELENVIQKYNESVQAFQVFCNDIQSKSIEQITEDDIEKYINQKQDINNYLRFINEIKQGLNKRQNEIKENLEKYNLVEKSTVVSPEEEQQIMEDLAKVDAVEVETFYELTQQTDEKIKQATNMLKQKE